MSFRLTIKTLIIWKLEPLSAFYTLPVSTKLRIWTLMNSIRTEMATLFRNTICQWKIFHFSVFVSFRWKDNQNSKKHADKLATLLEMCGMFLSNSVNVYCPSENLTIAEQLLGFRRGCPFKIYMASQPVKYGIKIVMTNNSLIFHMISAMLYI